MERCILFSCLVVVVNPLFSKAGELETELFVLSTSLHIETERDWQDNFTFFEATKHFGDITELELHHNIQLGQSGYLFAGYERNKQEKDEIVLGLKTRAFSVFTPGVWISHQGEVCFKLGADFEFTQESQLELEANTESEWSATLSYQLDNSTSLAISTNHISGLGLGFVTRF